MKQPDVKLTGYLDRLRAYAGQSLSAMVSSAMDEPYEVKLVRILCGDPNPDGPGYREEEVDCSANGTYPSRWQDIHLGSYGIVEGIAPSPASAGLEISVIVWPTLATRTGQVILSSTGPGLRFRLGMDPEAGATFEVEDEAGASIRCVAGKALRERNWYRLIARYDPLHSSITVRQEPLGNTWGQEHPVEGTAPAVLTDHAEFGFDRFFIAAGQALDGRITGHFNGKIEAPRMTTTGPEAGIIASWDFSLGIPTTTIHDVGGAGHSGQLVNLPVRAMRGSQWTGAFLNWNEAPGHYAAIHFHEDDIYDCGWQEDFRWEVPDGLKSGIYAFRLRCAGHEDRVPFFVRPRPGEPQSRLAVVIPTYTYLAYANFCTPNFTAEFQQRLAAWNAMPYNKTGPAYAGLSTYDTHTDGSGVCYSSRLRPIFSLRPRHLALMDPGGSGLRHLTADTYLISWLEHLSQDYDILTDEDVEDEGEALLKQYRCVILTSHPEYQTWATLDAYQGYAGNGGRLMYLGGNGFYWRITTSPKIPGVIELRRAEGGIRLWAAEPGEYYHALDGTYGGLWRRNGRTPNTIVGVGFSSQGDFEGSYYKRQPDSHDPRAAFVMEGIGEDEKIGDFGYWGGGAAGFELDRADTGLGTPHHALVVASSENHGPSFAHVTEELFGRFSHRKSEEVNRADLVYFETPNGGGVFSVGSIIWCGSLPWNGYDNNVSRITENVLRKFMDASPA